MAIDNTVSIVGNVTGDPELRHAKSGRPFVNLGLAHNRRWKNAAGEEQEATSFFTVVVWSDLALNIAETVTRGMRVVVTGRLEQRSWEAEDGSKRSTVEIVGEEVAPSLKWATAKVEKTNKRPGGASDREDPYGAAPAPAAAQAAQVPGYGDDDSPF